MSAQQLPGMPVPWRLTVTRTDDGRVVAVQAGPMLLSAFRAGDLEMRDLTICALTEGSRFQGKTVAAAFGILPSRVSRIRSRCRERGARGLARQMGPRRCSALPSCGRPAPAQDRPHPRRDRPQAGRVPVPDLRTAQTTRRAARPRLPARRRLARRHRRHPPPPYPARTTSRPHPPALAHRPVPQITTAGRTAATAPRAPAWTAPPASMGTAKGRARPGGWRRGSRPGRWGPHQHGVPVLGRSAR
jgi:hypothetical protein